MTASCDWEAASSSAKRPASPSTKPQATCMWSTRVTTACKEFSSEGTFLATWGWGVSDGKAEFEVCTSGCRSGLAGVGKGAS